MKSQRVRCIALLLLYAWHFVLACGHRHAPAALPPGKGPGFHCAGGWVGPRASLNGCGKSRHRRCPNPEPSVQPVESHTDCVILANTLNVGSCNIAW